jgi:membrane protein DedA with SNARE-associated domain
MGAMLSTPCLCGISRCCGVIFICPALCALWLWVCSCVGLPVLLIETLLVFLKLKEKNTHKIAGLVIGLPVPAALLAIVALVSP